MKLLWEVLKLLNRGSIAVAFLPPCSLRFLPVNHLAQMKVVEDIEIVAHTYILHRLLRLLKRSSKMSLQLVEPLFGDRIILRQFLAIEN